MTALQSRGAPALTRSELSAPRQAWCGLVMKNIGCGGRETWVSSRPQHSLTVSGPLSGAHCPHLQHEQLGYMISHTALTHPQVRGDSVDPPLAFSRLCLCPVTSNLL